MSRQPLSLLHWGLVLLMAASTAKCGREESAVPLPLELTRPYLSPPEEPPLGKARLEKVAEVRLEIPASLPPPKTWGRFSAAPDSLFLGDPSTKTVWRFSREGKFLRRFNQLEGPLQVIEYLKDIHFSTIHDRLFVSDLLGTLVFLRDGTFVRRLAIPMYSYRLAETASGRLLVNSSGREGPFWTAIDPAAPAAPAEQFYLLRRKLLPPGEEFLAAYSPHSRAEIDSGGNIYIAATALYELRKFDSRLNYLGDFRIQQDPHLVPPPKALSEEQKDDLRMAKGPRFSALLHFMLAAEKFLVLHYWVPELKETRLHFYHLDGRPAFAQIWWRGAVFLGRDSEGRIWGMKRRDKSVLEIYELSAPDN